VNQHRPGIVRQTSWNQRANTRFEGLKVGLGIGKLVDTRGVVYLQIICN